MEFIMKRLALIVVLVLALLPLGGCHGRKKASLEPQERGSDKQMYENAVARLRRSPDKARLIFKEIVQLFPDSIYAAKAKLGIADSYFRSRDDSSLLIAATEYQDYVNLFPYSPDAVYAKYQVGMCYFKQMRKPGRDQTNTFSALRGFEGVVQQYPGTPEAEEAKKRIAEARNTLATHFYRIGYYNLKLGAAEGAVARFKQVIDEYPEFKRMDALYYYTGRSYLALNGFELARSFFQRVITTFPSSKYAKKARKMLKATEEREKGFPARSPAPAPAAEAKA